MRYLELMKMIDIKNTLVHITQQQREKSDNATTEQTCRLDSQRQLPLLGTANQTRRSLVVSPHVVSRDEVINQSRPGLLALMGQSRRLV